MTHNRLRIWLLCALITFLPLSAWLVSYSGNYLLSLGRDILLGLFLLVTAAGYKSWRKPAALFWLALGFIALTLLSYLGHQNSLAQWLRGVRYLIEPIVLLSALLLGPLPKEAVKPLGQALGASLLLVLAGAIIDYFNPDFLRTTLSAGGIGFLGQVHLAANLPRLQATLAGPNALGLFLLVILLLTPIWSKTWPRWLSVPAVLLGAVVLGLTFSRSSYIGLALGLPLLLILMTRQWPAAKKWLLALVIVMVAGVGLLLITKPEQLTRVSSNQMRLEQYGRIWRERGEIGLTGRGAGTAGPFSDTSFDKSPTYYSENTYLDIYENIGPLGALIYIALWSWLVVVLARQRTLVSLSAAATVFGLGVAGLFIDHYTGQAALWLTVLCAGVLVGSESEVSKNPSPAPAKAVIEAGA